MTTRTRGRTPVLSQQNPSTEKASLLRRTVSPRSVSRPRSARTPSTERDPSHHNGHSPRSWSRSLSRSRKLSRSRSRSRGSRWHKKRRYTRTPSPATNLPRSSKIVVEKLTKNVTESHLREVFGSFGVIESLDIPMNKAFMTNRGTAYILYHDPADAEAAIAHMHEAQFDGAVLSVSIVLPRRAFSRSPPPPQVGWANSNRQRYGRGQQPDVRYPRSSLRSPTNSRRFGRGRPMEMHDLYRPQSSSRSRSPRRSHSISEPRSTSPPRQMGQPRPGSSRRSRRRSPSYSNYDYSSRSGRSRSSSIGRSQPRHSPSGR
ncbi:hypothetical protein BDV25DRAFT_157436 [Aspergillus avenaceus]|uniref:RRM domain-containing protein n=1 Tax=Aspergillus avenaceus TaxID=36643 RepID=A0A5N6TR75_ASPAV|nr:hypothetical protein BDV25DRAFT_157436 [Aspergillus avenaceus]